jgi:hypothetical protein
MVQLLKQTFGRLEKGAPIFRMHTQGKAPVEYLVRSVETASPMKYGIGMVKISFFKVSIPNPEKLTPQELVDSAIKNELDLPVDWLVVPKHEECIMTMTIPPLIYGASKQALEDFMIRRH